MVDEDRTSVRIQSVRHNPIRATENVMYATADAAGMSQSAES